MNLEALALVRVPLLPVLATGFVACVAGGVLAWRQRLRQSAEGRRAAHDQQHLRLLVEQLPVIAWSVDRELRIDSAAGAGLRALRLSPGEIVGLTVGELLGDDPVAEPALALHRRALAGEAAADDPSWRGRDFHVRVEPLRGDGGDVVGGVGVALDVTEQRRREAAYPEAQRLESLGVLAGGIAHDLANLLTGVLGHAELGLQRLPPDSPARPHLEQAIEGVHRGGELTRQLLAYAGRAVLRREAVDLGVLVRGMGDLLRVSLAGGCELRYEIDGSLPAVEADAAQLRQIVMNLITNGAEAIGDAGGVITVTAGRRRLTPAELAGFQFGDALVAGDFVSLRVADTGAGMSDEVRARIFEAFYSTKRAGRGLGLAAVLGIVREHGGAIRVDSAPGRGSAFEIVLPPARPAAKMAS
ncbi:MAG: ATP-binding protein [Thermoanaerobaculia bacterium]|nr:ATP-binding protein [Thermoanaerobaculia bacterium]